MRPTSEPTLALSGILVGNSFHSQNVVRPRIADISQKSSPSAVVLRCGMPCLGRGSQPPSRTGRDRVHPSTSPSSGCQVISLWNSSSEASFGTSPGLGAASLQVLSPGQFSPELSCLSPVRGHRLNRIWRPSQHTSGTAILSGSTSQT